MTHLTCVTPIQINHNFEVCETYPDEVAVPRDVTDEQIGNACPFRTKNRFPVLCWIHPDTKATLTRYDTYFMASFINDG